MARTETLRIDFDIELASINKLEDALEGVQEELKDISQTDPKFEELSKEAATLSNQLEKANKAAEGFTNEKKFLAADGAIKVLGGSLAGVVGVLGTLGVESEAFGDLEKKAASAIAVAIGIKDVSEGFKQLRESTVLATAATKIFGVVSKKALIATGIGALVVAVGALAANWDKVTAALKGATAEQKVYEEVAEDVTKEQTEFLTTVNETRSALALAKQGVIDKEKALKDYNEKLGESTGYADDINQAEKLLGENTPKYIKIIAARAEAQALFAAAAQEAVKAASGEDTDLSFWDKLKAKFTIKENYDYNQIINDVREENRNKREEKRIKLLDAANKKLEEANRLQGELTPGADTDDETEDGEDKETKKLEKRAEVTSVLVDNRKKLSKVESDNIDLQNIVKKNTDEMVSKQRKQNAATEVAIEDEIGRREALYATGDALMAVGDIIGQETAAGKALASSQALINTFLGVTEVLKQESTLPSPFDVIVKIANVATILASGLSAVRAINSTPVSETGTASASGGAISTGGGGARIPAQPTLPTADLEAAAPKVTSVQPTVRAYVVSGDVNSAQEADARLNRRRSLG